MDLTAGAIEKIKSGDIANDAVTVQVIFCASNSMLLSARTIMGIF